MNGFFSKTAIVFVAAALGGAGLFLEMYSNPDVQPFMVELREDGFHPATLTVSLGETVRFSTNLDRSFWPASDIHPAHGLYPEFDPKRPLAPEESWQFTFEKEGTWEFHDHLAPSFTGVIVVRTGTGTGSRQEACREGEQEYRCWLQDLRKTLSEEGLDAAFDRMGELYEQESEFALSCHSLAHDLGIAAYSLFLQDPDSVLTPKAAFCANGFYHGFMEGLLTSTRSPERAQEFCSLIEEQIVPEAPDAALQCYHGIGHGAMDLAVSTTLSQVQKTEQELLKPAIALCREISETEEQLYRCASGAFNSIANFYVKGEFQLRLDPEDPLRICRMQPEELKESCYGNMNTVLYWAASSDFAKAMAWVERMEEEDFAESATRYLAGLSALGVARGNFDEAVAMCREFENLRLACIEGFAHGFLEHGIPEEEYREAIAFCETESMETEEQEVCLSYVLSGLAGWYSLEKSHRICTEELPGEYWEYCSLRIREFQG